MLHLTAVSSGSEWFDLQGRVGQDTSCECRTNHDNVVQIVLTFDLPSWFIGDDKTSSDISQKWRLHFQYRNNAIITRTIRGVKAKLLVLLFEAEVGGDRDDPVYPVVLDCSHDRRKIDWLSTQDEFIVELHAGNGVHRLYIPNPCQDFLKRLTKRLRNMPHWDVRTAERLLDYASIRYESGGDILSRLED